MSPGSRRISGSEKMGFMGNPIKKVLTAPSRSGNPDMIIHAKSVVDKKRPQKKSNPLKIQKIFLEKPAHIE
jgi:hypothetical protein